MYLNMDVTLLVACSHVIKMTQKVDLCTEGGANGKDLLIKESSIKAIEMCRVLEKAGLI